MPIAFVLFHIELGREDKVVKLVREVEGVREAYRLLGPYDAVVKIETESVKKLWEIVSSKLRRLPNIRSTLTMIGPD